MDDRHGAKQPHRFDPARAAALDDDAREAWLPAPDIFALLDAPERARVVDFGAGTGHLTFKLAESRKDLHIFAFDEQEPMLQRLRERKTLLNAANVQVIGPAGFAELQDVDAILAVNVLHELGDAALESLAESLDARGTVLVADWNAIERPVGPPQDHVYSVDQAKKRLANAGLIVRLERLFPYHYVLLASLYR